jgi:hypothetical protein
LEGLASDTNIDPPLDTHHGELFRPDSILTRFYTILLNMRYVGKERDTRLALRGSR